VNNDGTINNLAVLGRFTFFGTIFNDGTFNNDGTVVNRGVFENDCNGVILGEGDILVNPIVNVCVIDATINIDPNTLNVNSKGNWITAYIELPENYDLADINVSTIFLNDVLQAEPKPSKIGDHDGDGVPDLRVKFDRETLSDMVEGDSSELHLSGELTDGTKFNGNDTIRVISKGWK